MKNRRNYYRILHVQPDAPMEIIRTSYRALMHKLKMHPDLGGDHWAAALLNEAFSTLSDPGRRGAYDCALKGMRELRRQGRAGLPRQVASPPPVREPAPSTRPDAKCFFCGARHRAQSIDLEQATCHRCQSPLFPASRHEGLTSTRRMLERLPRRMVVTCTAAGRPDMNLQMITEDVSLGGTCVISDYKLMAGQILRIEYSFGRAVGVVTRVAEHSSGWCAGVRFLTLQITEGRGVFLSVKG
jgi:hypothetical protein